jgi:hypothetical protein
MLIGYSAWGNNPEVYMQSAFSALTFLADPAVSEICVATERPEFYKKLSEKVTIIPISSAQLEEWGGPENYTYRRKIMGFKEIMNARPGNDYLFLDGDTFRGGSIAAVAKRLESGMFGMHESSGPFSRASDSSNRKLFSLFAGTQVEGYTITDSTVRYNAGALALPSALASEILMRTLRATEEIYRRTNGYWASEELAFNFVMMSLGEVGDISDGIGHYFGNKPQWNAMIVNFFSRAGLADMSLEAMIQEASSMDFTRIPVFLHPPRRRRQLMWLAEKYWPMTRPRYYPEKVQRWR